MEFKKNFYLKHNKFLKQVAVAALTPIKIIK